MGDAVGFGLGEAVGFGLGEAVGFGLGEAVGVGIGEAVGPGLGELVGDGNGEPVGEGVGVTDPNVPDSTTLAPLRTCTGIPAPIIGTLCPLFVSIERKIVLNWLTPACPTGELLAVIVKTVPVGRLIDDPWTSSRLRP